MVGREIKGNEQKWSFGAHYFVGRISDPYRMLKVQSANPVAVVGSFQTEKIKPAKTRRDDLRPFAPSSSPHPPPTMSPVQAHGIYAESFWNATVQMVEPFDPPNENVGWLTRELEVRQTQKNGWEVRTLGPTSVGSHSQELTGK